MKKLTKRFLVLILVLTSAISRGQTKALPSVSAGPAQTITLPVSSVTLTGSACDVGSTIASYAWTKVSGTGGTISNSTNNVATVSGLSKGAYVFKLTVTDNAGSSAACTVNVTVNAAAATNILPKCYAGSDLTIVLPVNSVTLKGSASDADGVIVSYLWTIETGCCGVVTSPASAGTTVTSLTKGSYRMRLTVTDNAGGTASDTLHITVFPSTPPPPPPPPVDTTHPGPTGGYNTLLYSNGFDKSSDLNSNQLGSGSISTTVFKSGTGSFNSLVTAGEGQISSGWRSEQQYPETYSMTGDEIATEYDEMFASLPNVGGLSVQWHGNVSGTSGETSLWITDGQLMVQRSVCGGAGCGNSYQSGSLIKIQTNRWYHMRWEIKFSAKSDGYERLYIDGVLYFSVNGQTTDGQGQYLKVGQNLFASPGVNSSLYIDNLNIWKKTVTGTALLFDNPWFTPNTANTPNNLVYYDFPLAIGDTSMSLGELRCGWVYDGQITPGRILFDTLSNTMLRNAFIKNGFSIVPAVSYICL